MAKDPAPPAPPPPVEICPKAGEEAALTLKTASGAEISVCGFEDHEVVSPKGKRAFSDFVVSYVAAPGAAQQKLFSSQTAETFWLKAVEGKGLELEEVWFFADQPKPAIWREVTCEAGACTISDAKCVFTMKANPFPRALKEFEKKRGRSEFENEGEELLDQIWAQALLGDKSAQDFYQQIPQGLDENLTEVFESNKAKLVEMKSLSCHK